MVPLPSSYQKKAAVVGAGPVGCLTAIMLANRGWKVSVYEGRADLRLPSTQATIRQRSINFTISHRGIAALQSVYPEAAERFMNHVSIPMRGRMVHHMDGRLDSQPYDRYGQCINSVDRAFLNADLLEQVCKIRDIEVFFRHKVRSVDFGEKKIFVEDLDQVQECKTVGFDLCIGADGSYSTVRREMMKVVRMDFQQEYIEHEYMELRMPASYNNAFILDSNHLHIWPRHSHMLVAMPNRDKTFTCTLFAPSYLFDSLETPEKFLQWFRSNFPDALEAIGEKNLLRDYSCNPRSALICTKANPYHYKSRGIILGDAAHSMVPFYGQGLNCGLEDVRVLKILFDQEHVQSVTASENTGTEDERLAKALARFSEERHKDLMAITDLAMGN
ncbi:putative kynurenine 3-monooxygenase [Moniliophthora roreri MCA 2997]|uniref:Kynurenine 3-monooxygenase n=2 Tax=Moniliophthora roreri TaxID=221103 RepID=V2XSZ6_MONRO|nr:putative kynurenine 3-monooxygenase [Moniliophthora roreri MCA 2997]